MAFPAPNIPEPVTEPQTLNRVIDQSVHIKGAIAQCAEELTSVNSTLTDELSGRHSELGLQGALTQSQSVKSKVQDCADDLTTVTLALQAEVLEREVLEHELLAAQGQEQAARHTALHDPLTSLPNRVLFNDRLQHGLAQATRHDWMLAVMFIDLDDFKDINDTHGHDAGDGALRIVAARLSAITRADDTVSRHGGDEFLYLLLELKNESDAHVIAEKIIATIAEPCEVAANAGNITLSVRCSIGVAIFPKDGATADALVQRADKAMYRAKRSQSGFAFDR